MAFKPNINLDIVLKRPLLHRVAILAAINVVIIAVVYFMLLTPKYDEIVSLDKKFQQVTRKLNESRTIASDIERFKRENAKLQAKLDVALAQLPNEKEIPDLIDSISDAVKDVGLNIFLFRPKPERVRGFYAEVPVAMSVQGGYESLYEFCDRIAKLSRIVNIEGMSVSLVGNERQPLLNAEFDVTTFRFISQPEGEVANVKNKKKKKR